MSGPKEENQSTLVFLLREFADFLKQFSTEVGKVINHQQNLVFVSSSIKSVNEKISQFFSVTVSLVKKLSDQYSEFTDTQLEYASRFVHGAKPNHEIWLQKLGQEKRRTFDPFSTSTTEPNAHLKRNPHMHMSVRAREYISLINDQYEYDSKTFGTVSPSKRLENQREVEQLESERQHFENLSEKYQNSLQEILDDLEDCIERLCPTRYEEVVDELAEKASKNWFENCKARFSAFLELLENFQPEDFENDSPHPMTLNNGTEIVLQSTGNATVSIPQNASEKLLTFLNQDALERESNMKQEYEKAVKYLKKQVKICDAKAVEFRLQWQTAVVQLEEAFRREKNLKLKLNQTKNLLEQTQDEFNTTKKNYETQNRLLSESLANLRAKQSATSETFLSSMFAKRGS